MATVFKKLIAVLMLLLLAGPSPLSAQSFNYGFKHLTTDQGLSHDNVYYITKDKQGFVWLGTMNGLNRYDGVRVVSFLHQPNDTTSLQHNFITGLECDKDGYIWVASDAGICRYNPHTEQFRILNFPDDGNLTRAYTATTSDERIFITRNHNLYELDARNFMAKKVADLGFDKGELRVFPAANGNLWIISSTALYFVDTKLFKLDYVMGRDDVHPTATPGVMTVYTDPNGKSWIGTWEAGLMSYNDQTKKTTSVAPRISFIVSIKADIDFAKNGLLWMSAGYAGLGQYNVNTGRFMDIPQNIQQPWSHNGSRVHTFYRDSLNGILWMGTEYGIEKYDHNTEHFARKMLPSSGAVGQFPSVNAVIKDKTDTSGRTWWISSWVSGFFKWNRHTDEITNYNSKLHSLEIFDLQQDDDGNIWIAEWRGV
ncbi:MAG: two-component regulator propeller domain-containing protein, partial [Chitinophagaceae bacterium]